MEDSNALNHELACLGLSNGALNVHTSAGSASGLCRTRVLGGTERTYCCQNCANLCAHYRGQASYESAYTPTMHLVSLQQRAGITACPVPGRQAPGACAQMYSSSQAQHSTAKARSCPSKSARINDPGTTRAKTSLETCIWEESVLTTKPGFSHVYSNPHTQRVRNSMHTRPTKA